MMLLNKLLEIVNAHGKKQKDISAALGLSQSYIAKLMSGKGKMSLAQFETLCNALNIDVQLINNNRQ